MGHFLYADYSSVVFFINLKKLLKSGLLRDDNIVAKQNAKRLISNKILCAKDSISQASWGFLSIKWRLTIPPISLTSFSISCFPDFSNSISSSKDLSKWSSIALLFRPVIIKILSTPEPIASSTIYWMVGLSTMGSISFGCALVAGKNLGPETRCGNYNFFDHSILQFYLSYYNIYFRKHQYKGYGNVIDFIYRHNRHIKQRSIWYGMPYY